eukprot:4305138-Karenia_brevis.AAC.1
MLDITIWQAPPRSVAVLTSCLEDFGALHTLNFAPTVVAARTHATVRIGALWMQTTIASRLSLWA